MAVVRNRIAAVHELLKTELKGPDAKNPEGIDYGVIPGTKKKTLYQSGAEKIALMFQFSASYQLSRTELPDGHCEVDAVCTLTHAPTGRIVGQAAGSASTMESKHRYRGASGKPCPECGAEACLPGKKEYGGGYFCKEANGGCGKKWKPGTPECAALEELASTRQENPDPSDQRNTVVKMAQKRAYVSAVKCAAAASELFTVDLEDSPPLHGEEKPAREPIRAPTEKQAPVPEGEEVTGLLEDFTVKKGKTKEGKDWEKYGMKVAGAWYGTFDPELADRAEIQKGTVITITWKPDGKYKTVVAVSDPPPAAATEQVPPQDDAQLGLALDKQAALE